MRVNESREVNEGHVDRSRGIEILITETLTNIKPTDPLR